MGNRISKFGLITQYGNEVRVEVTDVVLTGREEWKVYQLQRVDANRHPVHRTETTEEAVWVPHGTFSNPNEAHTAAKKLAGMPY